MKRPARPAHWLLVLSLACLSAPCQTLAADATAVIRRVEGLGGQVRYDAGKQVVGVNLLECPATDRDVKLLVGLGHLQEPAVGGPDIHDEGIQRLEALPRLTTLTLESTSLPMRGSNPSLRWAA